MAIVDQGQCPYVTPSSAMMLISVVSLVENDHSVGRTDWPAPTNRKNAIHLGVYAPVCGTVWCMSTDPCSDEVVEGEVDRLVLVFVERT